MQRACARIPQRAFCFSRLHAERLRCEGVRGEVTVLEGEYAGGEAQGRVEPYADSDLVVFAGRHIPEKRVPALVPALAALPDLRAVIYGDGPERGRLLSLIEEHGLTERVSAPGFVEHAQVDAALRSALCMVLPSRREGPSFDAQFREIEDIVRDRGIDYDPLVEPLKVFVGVDDSQLVAARVLEYTIRKHASCPVRFIPMEDVPTPQPKDPANRARTGFSFSRFHIPRLAGFRGRGVYMDADMQVFADVAELLRADMGSHMLLCTRQDKPPPAWEENDWFHPGRQMSMMVLDCERLQWDVGEIIAGMDRGEYGYTDLLFDMCIVPGDDIDDSLPPAWNHLKHYEPGTTRLLHYTVVPTQPWKSDANPLCELWEQAFAEARAAGLIYSTELRQAVWAGHVKRSLAGRAPASLPGRALDRALARIVPRAQATLHRFPRARHRALSMLRDR